MKKGIYLIVGAGILIWAGTISYWFYEDILYLLKDPTSYTSLVRTIGTIISWIFGIIYLYCGSRTERVNKATNISLLLLVAAFILSPTLGIFGCNTIGGQCSETEVLMSSISYSVFYYGIGLGFLALISSLFIKRKI
jgi:hypothetical protein